MSTDNKLQKTALYEEHIKLNAKIVPFAGYEMPVQYTSVKEEVNSVRNGVGVFDVSHMAEIFVEGSDAEGFVDTLVTNDIITPGIGKAIYSPMCRENGTVIDDLIVYKISKEKILLCVNAANHQKDWNHISQVKNNSSLKNFQLTDRSEQYSLLAIQGPRASSVLIDDLKILRQDSDLIYYSVKEASYNNQPVIVARTGYTGEDGFEIFCSHQTAISLWDKLIKSNVTPCGLASRDVLRLEACFPLYGHELSDDVTPLDSGLKWTVKFRNNRFIGEQALHSYNPKYQLIKISLDKGIPREGYQVENENGETIGKVTSGTMSPSINKGIAMVHVEKNRYSKEKDKKIFVVIRDKKYEASLHEKAF
ncbi:MAG: glycine cleavage system aminomethyltransferase GcvT, partial [Oligoflexia bacterium]|nr:glycine cleavage system aminomethyltransferase GcvT [Oligoflexia bacterium]